MKLRLTLILLSLIACAPLTQLCAQDQDKDIDLTGYKMTFSDEFDALSLSATSPKGAATWYYWPPYGAAGGFSVSQWNDAAFSVANGILTDKCWWDDSKKKWQSGCLSSMDTTGAGFSQQYGYFEAKMQMPKAGTGAWPAFWLLGANSIPNNDKNHLELDVLEWYGSCQGDVQQALHEWKADRTQVKGTLYKPYTRIPGNTPGGSAADRYHIYGLLVDPVHITWYIDGVQTNQAATPSDYITPMYLLINYAIGGGWPLKGAPFPTHGSSALLVDWVRVFSLPGASN